MPADLRSHVCRLKSQRRRPKRQRPGKIAPKPFGVVSMRVEAARMPVEAATGLGMKAC